MKFNMRRELYHSLPRNIFEGMQRKQLMCIIEICKGISYCGLNYKERM